jgi:hypothetical protein
MRAFPLKSKLIISNVVGGCARNEVFHRTLSKSRVVMTYKRSLSSLGSPMFPQMPVSDKVFTAAAVPKGEEDFMTR